MLRTPSAIEGQGGAIREDVARAKNRMLMVRDQMAQLAQENGLKVSDALLPTPVVSDNRGAASGEVAAGNPKHRLKVEVELIQASNEVKHLLPTVVASEGTKAPSQQDAETKSKTGQVWLSNVAKTLSNDALLGTPRVSAANGSTSSQAALGAPKGRIEDQIQYLHNESLSWGKFEPAIRRWETVLGRPAPDPTEPSGKDGAHRLSPWLTEWMMGLPSGWICGHGLKRAQELKLAGNGVCPQQATLALTLLTQDLELG